MKIIIKSPEKERIDLNGIPEDTIKRFGLSFSFCDLTNSHDLHNLIWTYNIVDEKKFMLACIEHGIKYTKHA
jgi:hypothetical protein